MIRWLGVACLAVGAAGVGLAAAGRLERREKLTRVYAALALAAGGMLTVVLL